MAAALLLCGSAPASAAPALLPLQRASNFTCGPAPGTDAAADAAAAGFNTCALGNDFTTPIPNTVGTGLPVNWLDCAADGSTSFVWYWGFIGPTSQVTVPSCSGHVAWNVQDPIYTNLALQLTLSDSDVSTYGNPASSMQTLNQSRSNPVPGPGEFGYAYYEWTFRDDSDVDVNNAFWTWTSPSAGVLAGQSQSVAELDFTENLGLNRSDAAINLWGPGGVNKGFHTVVSNAGLPDTSYHTWGALFTGDGGNNFSLCSYLDGVRQACAPWSYTATGENLQRRFLIAWIQHNGGTIGTVHQYIKSFKVLTCANWTLATAAGMCPGSTFNGNFYQ